MINEDLLENAFQCKLWDNFNNKIVKKLIDTSKLGLSEITFEEETLTKWCQDDEQLSSHNFTLDQIVSHLKVLGNKNHFQVMKNIIYPEPNDYPYSGTLQDLQRSRKRYVVHISWA